jgi:hypothetical protein
MKIIVLLAALVVAISQPSKQAHAQVETPSPIPGSYLASCPTSSYDIATQTITAQCYPINHQPLRASSLYYPACDPSLQTPWNDDGILHCFAPRGKMGDGGALPFGSYVATCGQFKVVVGRGPLSRFYTLYAQCSYNLNNGQTTGARPASLLLI